MRIAGRCRFFLRGCILTFSSHGPEFATMNACGSRLQMSAFGGKADISQGFDYSPKIKLDLARPFPTRIGRTRRSGDRRAPAKQSHHAEFASRQSRKSLPFTPVLDLCGILKGAHDDTQKFGAEGRSPKIFEGCRGCWRRRHCGAANRERFLAAGTSPARLPSALPPTAQTIAAETGTPKDLARIGGVAGSDFMVDVIKTLDIEYLRQIPLDLRAIQSR